MLKYFDKYPDVELVPEPVAQWCDVKGHNLLGIDHRSSKFIWAPCTVQLRSNQRKNLVYGIRCRN
jgi:hypothetical protein